MPDIDYDARHRKALAKAGPHRRIVERVILKYLRALHHEGSPAAGTILRTYFKEKV